MTFCSYEEAMFVNERRTLTTQFDDAFEFRSACVHEAGHMTLGYILGIKCVDVSVCVKYELDQGGLPVSKAYGGLVREAQEELRLVNKDLLISRYTARLARFAIFVAAGVAAERKFRIEHTMPLRSLLVAAEDHHAIEKIEKRLEAIDRKPGAFRRLVWRRVQRLIECPTVWEPLLELADELFESSYFSEDSDDLFRLTGSHAREILRSGGCRPKQIGGGGCGGGKR